MKRGPQVISGRLAGLILPFSQTAGVRPTLELVRKSFFDIVSGSLPGTAFLDVFAGSGIMGIEALSRGAEPVVFIESDPTVLKQLRKNIEITGMAAKTRLIHGDAAVVTDQSLSGISKTLIFCDPPYGDTHLSRIIDRFNQPLLRDKIILLAIEHHHKTLPLPDCCGWRVTKEKRYGETQLTFAVPDVHSNLEVAT